ncbi:hypothetical protein KPL71_011975 [Citrus sinensis]|uniref:Uncharacterized protein n=1 Tax=Citrus sinensis TaxID=2711 RepID=A0ACB8L7P9_CITSI|nr:hypothetical protein KPL71_011975 [Citrus sinensis]
MASTSSSTPSTPVTLSSTLSLPKSCSSHTTNKIENLVEYSYIPESAQISESSYPLLSPYHLYKRPSSFTRSIRTLISTRRPHPKEYIQSSRLDQCSLQATPAEQYVTLEIPPELIFNWKREGYTHLHLGGIRLILTLHGRKGLPVTARLAMLDTRFKQYQDAVIGTVLTTLYAGSVLLTFYPNFNLSLQDPNLPTTLKVQVQIQGAEQISSAKIATLHHQLVYRLQNHALDLPTLEHHSDTLMVLAESDQIPTIIQILRQIPRHELIKLMPLEWISNYEQSHNNTAPIQTSESMFERRQDGTVRMTFKPPPSAPQEPPRLSFTYSSMITAVQTAQEDLPITGFNYEGYPVYPAKHNGHFLWDAPGSGMCDPTCPCWDDWEEDDDYVPRRKKKPKRKKPPVSCHHYDPKPPQDPPPPPAPLPYYQKELQWIAKHCRSETPSPIPLPTPPLTCMMFSSTSSDYSSSFLPLEPHTDSHRNVVSKPFIPSPITSTGHLEPPKPFESVLNWQTQNARAQNDTLLNINSKVENISLRTEQLETKVDSISAQMQQIHQNLQSRIAQLDSELRAMLAQCYYGPEFDQKEREIRRLKAELAQIESEKQRPTLFTTSPSIPSIDDQTSDSNLAVSDSHTETDTESSVSTSDSEKSYADITRILMAQPDQPPHGQTSHIEPYVDIPSEVEEEMPESSATNQPPPAQAHTSSPSQKSSNGPWFTFDDLPSHKWRDRLNEMSAWIDLQMLRPGATTQSVLREFATHFTGALRDWFDSLGNYRQLQFVQLPEVSSALAVIHDQFLGDPSAVFEAARRDYLNMKCCSLNAKDLDFHYKRMSLLFYKLNGFNEPTLKHVFLASLPDELQPDIQRQLTASNLSLDNISLDLVDPESLTDSSEISHLLPETLNEENQADVSSARRKAILPKTVPTSEKNLFDSDQSQIIFHQQLLSLDTTIPIPSIKLQILPSKFQRPIPAIGLIDTGAQRSMLNPYLLPPEYWTDYEEHFKAVNGKLFTTSLITKKPIGSHDEHRQLLTQFYDIVQNHGIMLSAKKSTIATNNIEFLDASDDSWGAILLEEINGKEHFIAYASRQFSDTQKHYHRVFKEILAVKNGIKKFEYHLIGHHFLIRMDSSAFPNILNFKGKTVPEKMLLRLKDWFSKYDFSVKHIKGSQNLIPDMLSRLSKPEKPLTLFSTTYHFPIISMATSLPPEALTKKTFPFNKTFSFVFAIQEFARKALFRFFMKAYLVTEPFPFSSFHPENLFLTGLTLDPSRETTEDVLWYLWCLTVLYATKLVLPITPTLEHLLDPDKATSLTWTLLEWFSPIPWWRKKLQQLSEIYNLERMPASEAQMFTSVFIIHRPYFQHPDTKLFWTQDQVYEWFTAPYLAIIENEIQDVLHNYLCQLNHQPPPLKDIFHTSLGPQHDLLMIPTPSAISKPKSTGIIIKEEKPDYTDLLFQDSQDPWEDFLPLSQHL